MNKEKLDRILKKAQKEIEEKNARQLFDINKQWEKIALSVLNVAYDWDLEDMNLIRPNYPGIDLGDCGRHIGVQVSTDSTPAKIKQTLTTVQTAKVSGRLIGEDYYHIYFFIPGKKQTSYRNDFDVNENIIFSLKNIIDFDDFRKIFADLSKEKQEIILSILHRELFKRPKYQLSAALSAGCDFVAGSRKKELQEIDEKFLKSNRVFLWGLGGIGKTELAVEWGMHKEDVYLVHYRKSIRDTVMDMDFSGLHYIPSKPGMTDEQKKEEEFRQRLDILRDYYRDAVIIIDNFDNGEMTFAKMQNQPDYKALIRLPNKFLFTTRFMVKESSVHVEEMDVEDLLILAKQNYNNYQSDLDDILRKLIYKADRHTLTVDVMSKTLYASCGRLTPEVLLRAFEERKIDDSELPAVAAYHNSEDSDYDLREIRIYEHLRLLFNMTELEEIHKNVMRHAVLIPMEGMPVSLFRRCHTKEEQDAIETKIFQRSWLRLDRTHTTISVHSVIREVCRNELKPDDDNCKHFLKKLCQNFSAVHDDQEMVKSVADTVGNAAEVLPDHLGEWNWTAGNYYRSLGKYQKAIEHFKKAAVLREHRKDTILAEIYSNIGNTYTNLKEFEISIEYHEKSLEICQAVQEPDYRKISRRYNDMGLAYSYKAEKEQIYEWYEKAIQCYEEALKYNRMAVPANLLHISNVLNNLGNTYSNIGKTWRDSANYQIALKYHIEAKDIRENLPDISPKNLARSYKNIGNDYANLNQNDQALDYRIKALVIYQEVLHDGHPELANAYQDVGNTCRLTKRYDEALTYYTDAEKIWKKELPQNIFLLAKCQYAIGTIYSEYSQTGKDDQHEKALEYYLLALKGYQKAPKTYKREIDRCRGVIGETYLKLGRNEEALRYLKERNQNSECVKKSRYQQVKQYHHLGKICRREKQFEEALEHYLKILEIREKYFGNDFRNLIEINFEIACIYRDLRKPQNAMKHLQTALDICEVQLPEEQKTLRKIRRTIEITNGELK